MTRPPTRGTSRGSNGSQPSPMQSRRGRILEHLDGKYHRGELPVIGWLCCDLYDGSMGLGWKYLIRLRFWLVMRATKLHRCRTRKWFGASSGDDRFCDICNHRWWFFDGDWMEHQHAYKAGLIR